MCHIQEGRGSFLTLSPIKFYITAVLFLYIFTITVSRIIKYYDICITDLKSFSQNTALTRAGIPFHEGRLQHIIWGRGEAGAWHRGQDAAWDVHIS